MPSALDGFLEHDCSDELAGRLRAEIAANAGVGWDHFEFDLFNLELFYAEGRAVVTADWMTEYDDVEVTFERLLAALPDVPLGRRLRDA